MKFTCLNKVVAMKKMALLLGSVGIFTAACTPLQIDQQSDHVTDRQEDAAACLYLYDNEKMNVAPEGCIPVLLNSEAPGLELAVKRRELSQDYATTDECWWCAYQDEALNRLVEAAISDSSAIASRVDILKETQKVIKRDLTDSEQMQEALITGIIDIHFEVSYLKDTIAHTQRQVKLYQGIVAATTKNIAIKKATTADLERAQTQLTKYQSNLRQYKESLAYEQAILEGIVYGKPVLVPRLSVRVR